jgi:hypothetical protein
MLLIMEHLSGWNCICHWRSDFSRLLRSFWRDSVSGTVLDTFVSVPWVTGNRLCDYIICRVPVGSANFHLEHASDLLVFADELRCGALLLP